MGKYEGQLDDPQLVGDETDGYPVPVRTVLNYESRGELAVDQSVPEPVAGWQLQPGTQAWHYLRADADRAVCGIWHRSQSQVVWPRRPSAGLCEFCADIVNRSL